MKKFYPKLFFAFFLLHSAAWAFGAGSQLNQFFIQNQGQVKDELGNPATNVLFYNTGSAMQLFITDRGYSVVVPQIDKSGRTLNKIDFVFEKATLNKEQVIFVKGTPPLVHFYGPGGNKSTEDVNTSQTVIIRNLYPGIDWMWSFDKNGLPKHEFMVNLGADASVIQYSVTGATPKLNGENNIEYTHEKFGVVEGPVLFEYRDKTIPGKISVQGNHISYQFPKEWKAGGFTIDPPIALQWSLGLDTLNTAFKSIVADSNNNTYTTGYSSDFAFPVFPQINGSYTSTNPRSRDVVIVKTDWRQEIVWVTFYGGSGNDEGNAITNSPSGIFITGYSESWDFPQATLGNYNMPVALFGRDAFIAKFDHEGRWKWSTGYGGNGTDEALDIKYYNGKIYVAGYTTSHDFPVLQRVGSYFYQDTTITRSDAFLLEFDTLANRQWATCFGGSGEDYFTSVFADASGIYTTGYSDSVTGGSIPLQSLGTAYFQNSFQNTESFVNLFSQPGTLQWSTYFGGSGNDYASCIMHNNCGLFICGKTDGPGLPVLSQNNGNYYQANYSGGNSDGFIAKFDAATLQQYYCSYYGTPGNDALVHLTSDTGCNTIFTGFSDNSGLTLYGSAGQFYNYPRKGGYDGIMLGLNSAQVPFWATYFGSYINDFGYAVECTNIHIVDMVGEGFYNYGKDTIAGTYNDVNCFGSFYCPKVTTNGASNRFFNLDTISGFGYDTIPGGCGSELLFQALIPLKNTCPNQCNGWAKIDTSNIGGCPPFVLLWNNGDHGVTDTSLCELYWSRIFDNNGQYHTVYGRFNVLRCPPAGPVSTNCGLVPNWNSMIHPEGGGPPYTIVNRGMVGNGCPNTVYFNISDTAGCVLSYSIDWFENNVNMQPTLSFGTGCTLRAYLPVPLNGCIDLSGSSSWRWVITSDTTTFVVPFANDQAGDFITTALPDHSYTGYLDMGDCQLSLGSLFSFGPIHYSFTRVLPCQDTVGSIIVTVYPDTTAINAVGGYQVLIHLHGSSGTNQTFVANMSGLGSQTITMNNLPADNYTISLVIPPPNPGSSTCDSVVFTTALQSIRFTFGSVNTFCGDTSVLYANVTGGYAPFTFSWSANNTGADSIFVYAPGTYSLTVTDDSGCVYYNSTIVNGSPALRITGVQENLQPCAATLFSVATVTTSGGTPPLSIVWSSGESGSPANFLPQGADWVRVTDANGCMATDTFQNTKQLPMFTTDSVTNLRCYGDHTGAINLFVSDGYPPYTMHWSNGSSSINLTGLAAGNYSYTLTDTKSCHQYGTVTVTHPPLYSFTINTQDATCAQYDGIAQVNVSGGTPPYSILWSDGSTNFMRSDLSAYTSYPFTVTDSNGCQIIGQANVGMYTPMYVLNENIINVTCSGAQDGSFTIDLGNAFLPLTFSWSTGAITQNFSFAEGTLSNLSGGSYDVYAQDQFGCYLFIPFTINEPTPIIIDSVITLPAACSGINGAAHVYAHGGTPGYTLLWSDGGVGAVRNNLAPGSNSFTLTDNNGCTKTDTIFILTATPVQASLTTTNVLCYGDSTGSANLTVNVGAPPYSYLWSMGDTSSLVQNLMFGNYTVTVTDQNGCNFSSTFTISQPPSLTGSIAIITEPNCTTDGTIRIYTSGGVAPYYAWGTFYPDSTTIVGVPSGVYNPFVTDSNGCTLPLSITLTNPLAPQGFLTTQNPLCYGTNTGSVTITMTQGLSPFNYQGTLFTDSIVVGNLYSQGYNFAVTDSAGCADTLSTYLSQPPQLFGSYNILQPVICNNDSALVTIYSFGGTLPVSGTGTFEFAPGSYQQILIDTNGCSDTVAFVVVNPPVLTVSNIIIQPGCGNSFATVTISASGGVGPYHFQTGSGTVTFSDTVSLILTVGTYTFQITDSLGCVKTITVTIQQGSNPHGTLRSLNVPCYGDSSGAIVIAMQQGVQPFSVNAMPFTDSIQIGNLPVGAYNFTVIDSTGCTTQLSGIITQPPLLQIDSNLVQRGVTCYGRNDAVINVLANGGTLAYTYVLTDSAGNNTTQNNGLFSDLAAGSYVIQVIDSAGCSKSISIVIEGFTHSRDSVATDSVSCYGGNQGAIKIYSTPSDRNPYNYSLNNGDMQVYNVFYNLTAGNYNVVISDKNNCTDTLYVTLAQPDSIDGRVWLNGDLLPIDSFTLDERQLATFTKQNQNPWSISFSPDLQVLESSIAINKTQPRQDVTYTVIIYKDSTDRSCFVEYKGLLVVRPVPDFPNVITPNGDGFNDKWEIDLDKFPNAEVSIFDRWGELVFKSERYQNNWDGTYKQTGKHVADGTYYFIMKVVSQGGKVYKGDINVLDSSH